MIVVRGLIALLFACTCWRHSKASETTVVGVVSKSIVLKCDIPHSDPPIVSWVDQVYNTGHEPQPIFSSDGGMDDSHANRQNLSVSVDDFALTISNLQLERGAGKYICRSEVDGKTNERIYDLVVRGTPHCSGDHELMSGDPTTMSCEVRLAGNFRPALTWSRDGAVVPSRDGSSIGNALLRVSLDRVGPDDDKAQFLCEMTVADVVEDSCTITLDVSYGVTDMQFTPNRSVLSVDEELRCSARGNPTPEVALGPAAVVKKAKSGDGWSSLVVQADWVGRTMTVECSAANSVDGREFSESHSVTFNVTEKASTQQSSSINSTVIIAVVIIAIMLVAAIIIAVCIVYVIRPRRSKKPPKGLQASTLTEENGGSKPIPTKDDSAPEHRGTNGQTATA